MIQGARDLSFERQKVSIQEQQPHSSQDSDIGPHGSHTAIGSDIGTGHRLSSNQHAWPTAAAAADAPVSSMGPPPAPPAPPLSGPIPGMPRSGRMSAASSEGGALHGSSDHGGMPVESEADAHATDTHFPGPGSMMDSVGPEDDKVPQPQAMIGSHCLLEIPAQPSVEHAAPTPPARINESDPLTPGNAMQHPWDSQSQGEASQKSHARTDDDADSMRSASATTSAEEAVHSPPSESSWARWSKKASSLIKDTVTDPSSRFSLAGMGLAAGAAYLAYGDGFLYSGVQGSTGSRILANTLSALSLAGIEGYRVFSAMPPESTTGSDTDTSADTNKSDKSWSGTYRRCKKSISDLITGISDPKRSVQRLGNATFKLEDAAPALTKYAGLCAGSVSPTGVFLASAGEFGANVVMRQLRAQD